jgi:hypothetical protein
MHNADWFRPFVEHLVCTSKTQGCKTTLNYYPTSCKRKKHQHKSSPWVERHLGIAFHKEKLGEKGNMGWRKRKNKNKNKKMVGCGRVERVVLLSCGGVR